MAAQSVAVKGSRRAPPRPLGVFARDGDVSAPARGFFAYAVGDRIGADLTVLGHLATGRRGHLYQVWSASEWNGFTCKVLARNRRTSRRDRAALRREGQVLRASHHPNIVRLYGEGEHEGLPYLVLEYLEGPTLAAVLEDRPGRRLDAGEAVRAAIHVGAALDHLHRRGWLHLDVKPGNLLLRGGVPVLVDLDSARRVGAGTPARRIGTGPYMAPEQVERLPLGPAADVYGLGALLYELLTGRWPFEEAYEEAGSRSEAVYPQAHGEPPPGARRFVADVPTSLEAIVRRCLAPRPADRFEGIPPLLRALHAELSQPAALWPPGVRPAWGADAGPSTGNREAPARSAEAG